MNDFKNIMLDGEKVLWSGQPTRVSRVAIVFSLFSLVLCGVFLLPLGQAAITGDMSVFERINFSINGERVTVDTPVSEIRSALIAVVIMLVFLLVCGGVWLFSSLKKEFLLTDRRVIIQTIIPIKKVTSIQLTNIFLTERSGNEKIGTVTLFPTTPGIFSRIMSLYQIPVNSLTNINNPQEVEALILNSIAQMRQEKSP